jgi:hypothetical protein
MLVVSALSFARTPNGPVTRAELKAEVAAARGDGTLHTSKVQYAAGPSQGGNDNVACGTATSGSSEVGSPVMSHQLTASRPYTLFEHHQAESSHAGN